MFRHFVVNTPVECYWQGTECPPQDFPSPMVKGDVQAEISLDVLMCLRVLSEDRGLAVQMGSLGC